MRFLVALGLGLGAGAAAAGPAPVIGGSDAPAGKWPDAAAILYRDPQTGKDGQLCSGVLVGPSVVLTAGHCDPQVDATLPPLDNVLLGTASLAKPGDGETIAVARTVPYPDSQASIDISALVLAHAANETPRRIATGWARLDITNGATVELVGYGAIDMNGNTYVDALQQAETTIDDFDCALASGCHTLARPDGELAAGGGGVDTCNGDSGGPLYLLAGYGTYLAGVTSRAYDNATVFCGGGGIYERPDKIVAWLEQATGMAIAHGPEPRFGAITARVGSAGETTIAANDPKSKVHAFAITTPPAQGTAAVRDDGRVRVCVDPAANAGDDSLVVTITDANDATRALAITVPITIVDGKPPATACDPEAFSEGGGCCDSGRDPRGSWLLALAAVVVVSRRWPRRG